MNAEAGRIERRGGYTLVEAVVAAGLVGIIAMIAVAGYRNRLPTYRLERSVLELTGALQEARMRAVSDSCDVTVSCDPTNEWVGVWVDANTNGVGDAGETNTVSVAAVPGLSLGINSAVGRFDARGAFHCSNGFWDIQLTMSTVGDRHIYVLPSGQVEWRDTAK